MQIGPEKLLKVSKAFVIVTRTYNLMLADVAEQSVSRCEPWSRLYGAYHSSRAHLSRAS